jgi:hypothetical protein
MANFLLIFLYCDPALLLIAYRIKVYVQAEYNHVCNMYLLCSCCYWLIPRWLCLVGPSTGGPVGLVPL